MGTTASQYRKEVEDLKERIKKAVEEKRKADSEFHTLEGKKVEKEAAVLRAEKELSDIARELSSARDEISALARKEADLHALVANTERKAEDAATKEREEKK